MYKVERLIVKIGKALPFVLCFFVLISIIEVAYSYTNERYADGRLYLPISWSIGYIVRYDWLTIVAMLSLSYGLSNCWRNKAAIFYLIFNLIQKFIIESITMNSTLIYYYIVFNITILVVILFLGLQQGYINHKYKVYE